MSHAETRHLIADGLTLFFGPDDVFEVRVLEANGDPRKIVAGYLTGSKIRALGGKLAYIAEGSYGAYFTPQKLNPECLNRSRYFFPEVVRRNGEITPKLTSDPDVTAIRFLLVDIDPVRPPEHAKNSASDAEREAAGEVAARVKRTMHGLGWLAPLDIDSGNGRHLYYRLPRHDPPDTVTKLSLQAADLLLAITESQVVRCVASRA